MTPTALNLFFIQEMLKPVDPTATWERYVKRIQGRNSYATNPEKWRTRGRKWKRENAEIVRAYNYAWVRNNRSYRSAVLRERKNHDPELRMLDCLRTRVYKAVHGVNKNAQTKELIGMEIPEYRIYLQGQFRPGMTWENHGTIWHVDHIRPCAAFDFSDVETRDERLRKCFNWSNTQPLFAEENLRKGDRV